MRQNADTDEDLPLAVLGGPEPDKTGRFTNRDACGSTATRVVLTGRECYQRMQLIQLRKLRQIPGMRHRN